MAEYRTALESILDERLGIAQRKEQELAEASQRNQNTFNPINAGNLEHVDGDIETFFGMTDLMNVQTLHHRFANRQTGIEGCIRILEDDLHISASMLQRPRIHLGYVLPIKED